MGSVDIPKEIALVCSSGVSSQELERVAAALNRQIEEDFEPIWQKSTTVAVKTVAPDTGWYIELKPELPRPDAGGFHQTRLELEDGVPVLVPYALIDLSLVNQDPGKWSAAASHELLEMLVDPLGDYYSDPVPAPETFTNSTQVRYLIETCDPCALSFYEIDGVTVSDFVLPAYFEPSDGGAAKYSKTGKITQPRQVMKGGSVSFRDPTTGKPWWTHFRHDGKLHTEQVPDRYLVGVSAKASVDKARNDEEEVKVAGYKLLTKYLIELSEDKDLRDAYAADKAKAVEQSGLSQENKKILTDGNADEIQKALMQEDQTVLTATTYMVSHVVARA